MIWRRQRVTPDGRFRFDKDLGANRWLGTELASERPVLISELPNTDLSMEALRKLFEYDVEGVARLLSLESVPAQQAGIPDGALLVEAMPIGKSLAQESPDATKRAAIALELAHTVSRATRRGIALVGLRPDLIIVDASATIVPRSVLFLARRSTRVKLLTGPWAAADTTFASFVDPDPDLMLQADPRSDVYLLGLVISWMWTGRHAYADTAKTEFRGDLVEAMRYGSRDLWAGPAALDELLATMLVASAERRPIIDDVVTTLERA